MHSNQLVLHNNVDMSKYAFFANERQEYIPEISNEEMMVEQKLQQEQHMSRMFFGDNGGSLDDLYQIYLPKLEEIEKEAPAKLLKLAELDAESEDPFHEKKFEEANVIFAQQKLDTMDEFMNSKEPYNRLDPATHSQTTDYIKHTGWGSQTRTTSTYDPMRTTGAVDPNVPKQTYNSVPQAGKPVHLFDQIPRIQQNVQNVAWLSPKWGNEKTQGWGKYAHKNLWQKTKAFFKSDRGRILIKVGALMTIQLGMAVVGKKYAFEHLWQAGAFLCMMLGTFFITKELQRDGYDMRGFGI